MLVEACLELLFTPLTCVQICMQLRVVVALWYLGVMLVQIHRSVQSFNLFIYFLIYNMMQDLFGKLIFYKQNN